MNPDRRPNDSQQWMVPVSGSARKLAAGSRWSLVPLGQRAVREGWPRSSPADTALYVVGVRDGLSSEAIRGWQHLVGGATWGYPTIKPRRRTAGDTHIRRTWCHPTIRLGRPRRNGSYGQFPSAPPKSSLSSVAVCQTNCGEPLTDSAWCNRRVAPIWFGLVPT
jgi:hypothetical protein